MASEVVVATLVLGVVAVSFPAILYGAWIILEADPVTWSVLTRHLRYVLFGLLLTTVPVVGWMVPRLFGLGPYDAQFGGLAVLHAILGVHAYALLVFGLSGIVRIFRAKYEHNLYHDYDEEVLLSAIGGEAMAHWRRRLRIGVFGYTVLWILAFLTGVARYWSVYL